MLTGASSQDQVIVFRHPAPSVSAFPAVSTICSTSDTIQITATGVRAVSYLWTPAAGLTCSTCPSPKASPTATTTYSVVAIDSFGCQSPPFNVTVNLAPPPPVQSCSVIYATTSGTGTGTQADPASLATALIKAQCNNALIKLGIGTYTITSPITNISSYTTIEGGFDPAQAWKKTSTPGATVIYRSAVNLEASALGNDKRLVAIYFNGSNYFRFQDVTIQTADCPALAAGDNFGYSNYVVHMTNCRNYDFVRCQILPGKATNGRAGVSPAGVGTAATGGAAGGGGAGATTGCNKNGTGGGAGGSVPGAGGGGGGGGAVGNSCNWYGCNANAVGGGGGSAGTDGTVGTDASATAGATPSLTTTFFLAGAQGNNGTNGTAGGGGGGGGGGSMGTDCSCTINNTPNGGSGGAGGNGGLGATGGFGGGGTFGIYLVGNGTGGRFTDCDIIPNTAGLGGIGGTGQLGTLGTNGNAGITTTGSCGNVSGGSGAKGGDGKRGGNGQPGANGVSAGIISNGSAPTYTSNGVTTTISTGANSPAIFNLPSQPTIFCANISCTYRNDTLSSATSGAWTAGSGATVPSGSGTSLITQYTTTGRKDIGYNANSYRGFANIAIDQSSFIPVIQSSAAVLNPDTFWLCKGSTANFNMQIASADTFDWNFGGATAPNTYYGANYQNLSNLLFNTPGTFRITGRIKTSCCGWSPYDTTYLVVEPNASINYTGNTSFCAGDSVHIILSGTGTSYSWAPTAGVSNPTGSNVYIKPQVTTSYLVTSYSPRGLCNADTSITVSKAIPPTLAFTSTSATCGANGSIAVVPTPAGTYTYSWNPAGSTASLVNQTSGTYSVTVTPVGSNCSVSGASSINTGAGLQAYITRSVSPLCFGQCTGIVKVKAIGGASPYTYLWSNGATLDSLKNVCAGTYSVTITDNSGCTASASQILSQPQKLVVIVLDSFATKCASSCNGSAIVDGSGGTGPYSYIWSDPAHQTTNHPVNLCPGYYTVAAIDNNSCTATGSVTIKSPPILIADTLSVKNVSCFGGNDGKIVLKVQGGVGALLLYVES